MKRPEGWENPYSRKSNDPDVIWACKLWEAGASAMLEGLKAKGVYTYGYHTPDIELSDAPEVSGYWCFIPEGE